MPYRNVTRLLALAAVMLLQSAPCRAEKPPVEQGDFRPSELVELHPTAYLKLDIAYATTDNFLKTKMYEQARAFLQKPAADALRRASQRLAKKGLGLLVYDAYRPWYVTKFIWDRSPDAWRTGGYVADPAKGSRHNRGCAVDLTLYDLKTGRALDMPTEYDSFETAAHAYSDKGTQKQRRNRRILQEAMLAEGFQILDEEWWHFDYKDWRKYRIENVPFEDVP